MIAPIASAVKKAVETKPEVDVTEAQSEVPTIGATEGGCGGTVAFTSLALIASFGTITALGVSKKKRR